jgi:hypothetical protein
VTSIIRWHSDHQIEVLLISDRLVDHRVSVTFEWWSIRNGAIIESSTRSFDLPAQDTISIFTANVNDMQQSVDRNDRYFHVRVTTLGLDRIQHENGFWLDQLKQIDFRIPKISLIPLHPSLPDRIWMRLQVDEITPYVFMQTHW